MFGFKTYRLIYSLLFVTCLCFSLHVSAQAEEGEEEFIGPLPPIDHSKWGPNDTIITAAKFYRGEWMPHFAHEMIWVSNMPENKLRKYIEEYNRLRNAVYVTYPYARTAGNLMNDINEHLKGISDKKQRKEYIKSREKELKKQFSDPLSDLSVYQGKVLMKLINRQTGNNCYEIVKEYRGGLSARMYQTVAFFFGSSLKQKWDLTDKTDRQIEIFVKEVDALWYYNSPQPPKKTGTP